MGRRLSATVDGMYSTSSCSACYSWTTRLTLLHVHLPYYCSAACELTGRTTIPINLESNSTLGSCFSLCVKLTTVVGACLRLEMSANIRARTCNGVRFDDTTLSTDTPVLCLPSRISFITYQQDCTLQIQEGERSVVFPFRRIREDSRFEPSCSQAFPILIR